MLYREQRIFITVGQFTKDPANARRDSPNPCVVVKAGPVLRKPCRHAGRLVDALVFRQNVAHVLDQLLFSLAEDSAPTAHGVNFNRVDPFGNE